MFFKVLEGLENCGRLEGKNPLTFVQIQLDGAKSSPRKGWPRKIEQQISNAHEGLGMSCFIFLCSLPNVKRRSFGFERSSYRSETRRDEVNRKKQTTIPECKKTLRKQQKVPLACLFFATLTCELCICHVRWVLRKGKLRYRMVLMWSVGCQISNIIPIGLDVPALVLLIATHGWFHGPIATRDVKNKGKSECNVIVLLIAQDDCTHAFELSSERLSEWHRINLAEDPVTVRKRSAERSCQPFAQGPAIVRRSLAKCLTKS